MPLVISDLTRFVLAQIQLITTTGIAAWPLSAWTGVTVISKIMCYLEIMALKEAMENSHFCCRTKVFFECKLKAVCNYSCRLDLMLSFVYCVVYFSISATGKHTFADCRCLCCFKTRNLLPHMFENWLQLFGFLFFSEGDKHLVECGWVFHEPWEFSLINSITKLESFKNCVWEAGLQGFFLNYFLILYPNICMHCRDS